MRVRLLDRYLLGAFLRIFFLTAISAPLLFVLADITTRLDGYLAQGMSWMEILQLYPPQVPTYVVWTFPIAAMVATVFTLQPLARHGEIHAALGCGVPLQRLFVPLFAGGAAAAVLALILLEAMPRLERTPSAVLRASEVVRAERSTFAYRTAAGEFITVQRLEAGSEGRMSGVVLRSADDAPDGSARYIVANTAVWSEEQGWSFLNGSVWTVPGDGVPRMMQFERLVLRSLRERPVDLLEARSVDPTGMSFEELARFAATLERSGVSAAYPRIKQWERITIPLTTLVIIMFAAPLASSGVRGQAQLGTAVALVATIVYLALLRTSEALGFAGLLHPALAASFPALLFGVAGLLLLRRART